MDSGYIPKTLDNPARFFLFDMWQGMIFLLIFGLGIVLHLILYGLVLGAVLAYFYGKASSGQQSGFIIHLTAWFLAIEPGYKSVPKSYLRKFRG